MKIKDLLSVLDDTELFICNTQTNEKLWSGEDNWLNEDLQKYANFTILRLTNTLGCIFVYIDIKEILDNEK